MTDPARVLLMRTRVSQHQVEIERNLDAWRRKPLLRKICAAFYERILGLIDVRLPGRIVEIDRASET